MTGGIAVGSIGTVTEHVAPEGSRPTIPPEAPSGECESAALVGCSVLSGRARSVCGEHETVTARAAMATRDAIRRTPRDTPTLLSREAVLLLPTPQPAAGFQAPTTL